MEAVSTIKFCGMVNTVPLSVAQRRIISQQWIEQK